MHDGNNCVHGYCRRSLSSQLDAFVPNPECLPMSIIVQKFGGTSVADSKKILAAARKAIRAEKEGNQVVMVVSAMGKNTDVLIDLAKQITDEPPAREMDMLLSTGEQVSVALMAMAIHSLGHEAISLTGRPDRHHHRQHAHQGPHPLDLDRADPQGAGRGQDRHRGRLPGDRRGVQHHHAGPRRQRHHGRGPGRGARRRRLRDLHRRRRRLHDRSAGRARGPAGRADQLRRDARTGQAGAGVMHNRSIEFAKKFGVPVHVRSSFSDKPGTMIVAEPEAPNTAGLRGGGGQGRGPRHGPAACPTGPGAALAHLLEDRRQEHRHGHDRAERRRPTGGPTSRSPSSATICRPRSRPSKRPSRNWAPRATTATTTWRRSRWSGWAWPRRPGVAGTMFRALAEKGINIQMITTSEIKISVLVAREFAQEALRTVHEAFQLQRAARSGSRTAGRHSLRIA